MSRRIARLLGSLVAAAAIASAQMPSTGPQQRVLDLTNQDRVLEGLQPLAWDPALAAAAVRHAQTMANDGALSHQLGGEPGLTSRAAEAGAHFASIAENIAYGPSPEAIEREWMHSAPHRANILDPRMNSIGVGIVASEGVLWAVEDFADGVAKDSPAQVTATVAARLRLHGLTIVAADSAQAQAARAACPQADGGAGAHARFIIRWETAKLDQLPEPLTAAAAGGHYTLAAIGSCPALDSRNDGFTVYRVAVLLF